MARKKGNKKKGGGAAAATGGTAVTATEGEQQQPLSKREKKMAKKMVNERKNEIGKWASMMFQKHPDVKDWVNNFDWADCCKAVNLSPSYAELVRDLFAETVEQTRRAQEDVKKIKKIKKNKKKGNSDDDLMPSTQFSQSDSDSVSSLSSDEKDDPRDEDFDLFSSSEDDEDKGEEEENAEKHSPTKPREKGTQEQRKEKVNKVSAARGLHSDDDFDEEEEEDDDEGGERDPGHGKRKMTRSTRSSGKEKENVGPTTRTASTKASRAAHQERQSRSSISKEVKGGYVNDLLSSGGETEDDLTKPRKGKKNVTKGKQTAASAPKATTTSSSSSSSPLLGKRISPSDTTPQPQGQQQKESKVMKLLERIRLANNKEKKAAPLPVRKHQQPSGESTVTDAESREPTSDKEEESRAQKRVPTTSTSSSSPQKDVSPPFTKKRKHDEPPTSTLESNDSDSDSDKPVKKVKAMNRMELFMKGALATKKVPSSDTTHNAPPSNATSNGVTQGDLAPKVKRVHVDKTSGKRVWLIQSPGLNNGEPVECSEDFMRVYHGYTVLDFFKV